MHLCKLARFIWISVDWLRLLELWVVVWSWNIKFRILVVKLSTSHICGNYSMIPLLFWYGHICIVKSMVIYASVIFANWPHSIVSKLNKVETATPHHTPSASHTELNFWYSINWAQAISVIGGLYHIYVFHMWRLTTAIRLYADEKNEELWKSESFFEWSAFVSHFYVSDQICASRNLDTIASRRAGWLCASTTSSCSPKRCGSSTPLSVTGDDWKQWVDTPGKGKVVQHITKCELDELFPAVYQHMYMQW